MANTQYYNLYIYPSSDTTTRFLNYREQISGTGTTSNFVVLDTVLHQHSEILDSLVDRPSAYEVNATLAGENYYIATVSGITSFSTGIVIILSLDTDNTGTITLSINSLPTVSVMKYNNSGILVNMNEKDIRKNKPVLCVYNGTAFVLIGSTNGDDVNVSGNNGEILQISSTNSIESSGKSIGLPNGVATLDSSGKLVEELSLGSVSPNNLTQETKDLFATAAQGLKADNLVSGTISANNSTKLTVPKKIGNADFDGTSDIGLMEIGAIPIVTNAEVGKIAALNSDGTIYSSNVDVGTIFSVDGGVLNGTLEFLYGYGIKYRNSGTNDSFIIDNTSSGFRIRATGDTGPLGTILQWTIGSTASFSGNLSGNATTATTATTSSKINNVTAKFGTAIVTTNSSGVFSFTVSSSNTFLCVACKNGGADGSIQISDPSSGNTISGKAFTPAGTALGSTTIRISYVYFPITEV